VVPSSPAADRGDVAAAAVHVVGRGGRGRARPECAALGPGSGPVGGGAGGVESRRQRQGLGLP